MEWIKYSLDGVTACVVYTADSIRKFDSKSNRTADSIRTQKTIRRSLVLNIFAQCWAQLVQG